MKKLFTLSLALTFALFTVAQEKFKEGKITMSQKITTNNELMQSMMDEMVGGDAMTTIAYVKGNKSRSEVANPISGDVITISDMESMQTLLLMDSPILGRKYSLTAINKEEEDIIKDNVTITEGTESKTILGYTCKQYLAIIDMEGVKMEMELYITDKIVTVMSQQTSMLGDKLKGFPMYMVMKMNQQGMDMTIVTEVTDLNAEMVDDNKFSLTPPEGYSDIKGM